MLVRKQEKNNDGKKKDKNIIILHVLLNCCLSIRFADVNFILTVSYSSNRQILQSRHYIKPMK